MGILEDALNYQDAKRSQRMSREARKAKIDTNKIKEGTYRGIDLVDGTAMVQLDDQLSATSGYRLITNAPLGNGDRVSIRPNGVGLPRADARNVTPLVELTEVTTPELFVANLRLIEILTPSGVDDFTLFSTTNVFAKGLLEYEYKGKNLKFTKKRRFNINSNTVLPFPENPNAIYNLDFTGDNNFVTFTSGIPFSTGGYFALFQVYFDAVTWGDKFTPWIGSYTGANFFTAPIEVEITLNGITQFPSMLIDDVPNGYVLSADVQLISSPATVTFSFRYRRRVTSGDPLPWFQL